MQLQEPQRLRPARSPNVCRFVAKPIETMHLAGCIRIRKLALWLLILPDVPVCKGKALNYIVSLHNETPTLPTTNHINTPMDTAFRDRFLQGFPKSLCSRCPSMFVVATFFQQTLTMAEATQSCIMVHKTHEQVS
mmetsp:Transcript_123828/g.361552  ORF Transcript_123828/g.361552 Transcript_123828/m.361552 type:complete len:135 (-) Transcript_123828:611-1015(-)